MPIYHDLSEPGLPTNLTSDRVYLSATFIITSLSFFVEATPTYHIQDLLYLFQSAREHAMQTVLLTSRGSSVAPVKALRSHSSLFRSIKSPLMIGMYLEKSIVVSEHTSRTLTSITPLLPK
jgi:hypothetical protein